MTGVWIMILMALIVVIYFSYNQGRLYEINRWLEEKLKEMEEDNEEDGEEWKR